MKQASILFISNSFGDDTTYFMPYILRDFDIELSVSNLYIGGCEVCRHLDNIKGDKKVYEYRSFNHKTMKWDNKLEVSIKEALLERKWDYVVLQEASHLSGKKDDYLLVPSLIEEVKKIIDYYPIILWNMTWAYSKGSTHPCFEINYQSNQEIMFDGIVKNVEEIKKIKDIKKVIKCGAVIQKAREIFGDAPLHLPDGFHMSQPLGRFIVALTACKTIFGIDVDSVQYIPDGLSIKDKNKVVSLISSFETKD